MYLVPNRRENEGDDGGVGLSHYHVMFEETADGGQAMKRITLHIYTS